MSERLNVSVRPTTPADFGAIASLTGRVYPRSPAWSAEQLASHLRHFPEGQFVAERSDGEIVGMSASLIVFWDDYELTTSWRDFTDAGMFTNHDPRNGRTLYGAEIMVDPAAQGQGVGSSLYAAREALVRERGLLRIRAGARLRDYGQHAQHVSAETYLHAVANEELYDRTLSFQLRRGFRIIGLVSNYLRHDLESLGHAAVIEWRNPDIPNPKG